MTVNSLRARLAEIEGSLEVLARCEVEGELADLFIVAGVQVKMDPDTAEEFAVILSVNE